MFNVAVGTSEGFWAPSYSEKDISLGCLAGVVPKKEAGTTQRRYGYRNGTFCLVCAWLQMRMWRVRPMWTDLPSEADATVYMNFMKSHCCYDAIPVSCKLVIFDTQLQVREGHESSLSHLQCVCLCLLTLDVCDFYAPKGEESLLCTGGKWLEGCAFMGQQVADICG